MRVGERKIHLSIRIFEDAQAENLPYQIISIGSSICLRNAEEYQQAMPDLASDFSVDRYLSTRDALHDGPQCEVLLREKLFLCSRTRIQNNRQRGDAFRFHIVVYEKPLAVFGHVVAENVSGRDRRSSVKLKKRYRSASGKRTYGADWYRSQHAHGSEIENFFAVSAPARFGPSSTRNLPFSSSARKRGHVNFPVSRIIGCVRNPLPIGRNLTIPLASWTCLKRGGIPTRGWYQLKVLAR